MLLDQSVKYEIDMRLDLGEGIETDAFPIFDRAFDEPDFGREWHIVRQLSSQGSVEEFSLSR
jgi:hypothetical protein